MAQTPMTGQAGDSHAERMWKLTDMNSITFSHKTYHILSFARTDDLKHLIIENPETTAIIFSFGSNDLDHPFMTTRQDKHIQDIIRAFITVAKDTYQFGVLPFFVAIIPRTKFKSAVAIKEFDRAKTIVEERVRHELIKVLKYDPIIDIDHIVELDYDGVHLTTEAYMNAMELCDAYMLQVIIDHNNNNLMTDMETETEKEAETSKTEDPTPASGAISNNKYRSTMEPDPTPATGAIRKRRRSNEQQPGTRSEQTETTLPAIATTTTQMRQLTLSEDPLRTPNYFLRGQDQETHGI